MKPWSQLSLDEQRHLRIQMVLCDGRSANGVSGWYASLRDQKKPMVRKKPQVYRFDGVSVADEAPESIELEELNDVLPDRTN